MPLSIYDDIREKIVSGQHGPGAPLTEIALAEHYGVSRTPIREALHRLERDGFLDRKGRSVTVASRSPEEVLELYEFRALLEETAAKWAATRRTELDLTRLTYLQGEMKKVAEADVPTRVEANKVFHQQLWKAGHNASLTSALEHMYNQLHRYPEITIEFPGRWEEVLKEHDELVEAIAAGDAERAAECARSHMEGARNVRLRLLASS